jgi:riboflavin kinase/FMN adenylyltransferase
MPSTVKACLYPGAVQVWRSIGEVGLDDASRTVVTVGNFDGVHLGHQHLLAGVVARGRVLGVVSVVVTFDPHPMTVIHPDSAPPRLATLEHRLALLEQCDVDAVLVLPFTRELSLWEPDEFVRRVLVDALHAFEVVALPLAGDTSRWSSTYVRQCLAEGDVASAAAALGRPHRVEGPVVEGDKRGRQLGYPTANLDLPPETAVPEDGVYAGWLTRADGTRLPAAISIGTNPTFGGTTRRVEAYVLDRDDLELYGEHVAVDFLARLRETITFDGVEPLLVQMAEDVDQARALTAGR